MQTRRDDGFEIDTEPSRLDVPLVQEWLLTDAYWTGGRTRETVSRSIENSMSFGVYAPEGDQVGFARVVTDLATFAWVGDVYMARSVRGRGIGTWLVGVVTHHIQGLGVNRLVLATLDAHGVYAKVGFEPLATPERWMTIDLRPKMDI